LISSAAARFSRQISPQLKRASSPRADGDYEADNDGCDREPPAVDAQTGHLLQPDQGGDRRATNHDRASQSEVAPLG
jgi:hypothetical protein